MSEGKIYIRAKKDGKWQSVDIMEVDAEQFLDWVGLKLCQFKDGVDSWGENPDFKETQETHDKRRVRTVMHGYLNNPRAWIIHCLEGFNIAQIFRVIEGDSVE